MPNSSNKKLLLAYIYNILSEYSDEEHPLKQQQIITLLRSRYGMECERKAVAANLQSLEELGIGIQRLPNQGVYLGQRSFEPSEVTFLVDAIFSCKAISSRHAQELSEKLFQNLSVYQRKKYNYIHKSNQIARSDNRQLFYIIDLLGEAIAQKKQVQFNYIAYDLKGQLKRPTTVNPYFLVNNNGKYYLVCYNSRHESLSNYRIDRIADVCVSDAPVLPLHQVPGVRRDFDIAQYVNENIHMFGMGAVVAELEIRDLTAISYIYNWFGQNATILERDGRCIARVRVDEQALIYWVLQYGDFVELRSPASTRKKVLRMVKDMMAMYGAEE